MAKRLPPGRKKAARRTSPPARRKAASGADDPKARGSASPVALRQKVNALQAQLKAARRRIADLEARSETDILSGTLNRRGFERALRRSIAYVQRYDATAAMVFCDVDRLKPVNDRYGHAAGDAVLVAVASALSGHIRTSDILGRLGGDEFGLILWNVSGAKAAAKADALAQAVAAIELFFRDQRIAITATFGVALIEAADTPQDAIARADAAMYAARARLRAATGKSAGELSQM